MTKRVSSCGTYVAVVTRCVLCDAEITEYVPWRRRLNTVSDSPHKHRKRVVCADCFAREWAAMTGRTVAYPVRDEIVPPRGLLGRLRGHL